MFKLKFNQINLPDLSNREFNHFNKFHHCIDTLGKSKQHHHHPDLCALYSRLDPDGDRGLVMAQGAQAGAGLLAVLAGVEGPGRHLGGEGGLSGPGHLVTTADHGGLG